MTAPPGRTRVGGLVRKETKWGHSYRLDGRPVKGVTTLLKAYPKVLHYWSARCVAEFVADFPDEVEQMRAMGRGPMVAALKEVPWQKRDEAAIRGTEVHYWAEKVIYGNEHDIPAHLLGHVQGYVDFLDRFDVKPILTERPVASRKWWYAGTFDLVAKIGDTVWMLDNKTSSGVYPDTSMQVAAYANAEFYTDDDGAEHPMPETERYGVLHVRGDGTDLYPVKDPEHAWKCFQHVQFVAKQMDAVKKQITEPIYDPKELTA